MVCDVDLCAFVVPSEVCRVLERELESLQPIPGEPFWRSEPLGYCAVRSEVLRERLGAICFDGHGGGI